MMRLVTPLTNTLVVICCCVCNLFCFVVSVSDLTCLSGFVTSASAACIVLILLGFSFEFLPIIFTFCFVSFLFF